jgi:hypothetical protein
MQLALAMDTNDMNIVAGSATNLNTIVMVKQKNNSNTNQFGIGDQSIREAIAVNQQTACYSTLEYASELVFFVRKYCDIISITALCFNHAL